MFSFAIGTSSFKEVRQDPNGPIYLDKTVLIYEIFASSSKALLFTRPIRFMKSTNLSMISTFCDIRHRDENVMLFDGLKIKDASNLEYKRIWDAHFGQYPVISLSFKDISAANWGRSFESLKNLISTLFIEHDYLLSSEKLNTRQKTLITNLIDGQASLQNYQNSLLFLSQCLKKHYEKSVMILIDEYDTPLHHAHLYDEHKKKNSPQEQASTFDSMLEFMRSFLKAGLKDNDNLHKGIMTGVLRTAFGSLVSELNNVDVFSVLNQSPRFAPYFGVTTEDINFLMQTLSVAEQDTMRDVLRNTYNGYVIAGVLLHNPWSVMHYLRNYVETSKQSIEGRPYWLQTGDSGIIGIYMRKYYAEIYNDLEKLLEMKPLRISLNERSTLSEAGEGNLTAFWGLLLQCGYLTVSKIHNYTSIVADCDVRIPNNEIYGAYVYHMQHFLEPEKAEIANRRFMDSFLNENFENFATELETYLKEVVSYFDIQQTRAPEARNVRRKGARSSAQETVEKTGDEFLILPEMVFHVLVMGVIAGLHQVQYLLLSNRESGNGRHDLMLLPFSSKSPGIIFEFKKTDALSELDASAQQALTQIKEQQYAKALETYGVTHGIHIGLAFFGKNLRLKHEKVTYAPTVPFRLREPIGEIVAANTKEDAVKLPPQPSFTTYGTVFSSVKFQQLSISALQLYDVLDSVISIWCWEVGDAELIEAKKASMQEFLSRNTFSQISATTGLTLERMQGDGNCFFHSIFDQLQRRYPTILKTIATITGQTVDHQTLRKLAIGALIKLQDRADNAEAFKQNMNAYIQEQHRNGAWAEGEIIRAMANVLGVTLVLANSNEDQPTVITEGNDGVLYLAYHVGVHFDSLTGTPAQVFHEQIAARQVQSAPSVNIPLTAAWSANTNNQHRHTNF